MGENIDTLYQKMNNEKFRGEIILDNLWIIWKLTNDITIKATIDDMQNEGYISIYYSKKTLESTHWHPELEDLYNDLLKINTGELFAVRKKKGFFFRNHIFMMYKKYWDSLGEREKGKYIAL